MKSIPYFREANKVVDWLSNKVSPAGCTCFSSPLEQELVDIVAQDKAGTWYLKNK